MSAPAKPQESYIEVGRGGTAYVGPDATRLLAAQVLASSLKLYARAKILPTRGVSASRLLVLAQGYTGKCYKRGEHLKAAEDVQKWTDVMKSALPIERRE